MKQSTVKLSTLYYKDKKNKVYMWQVYSDNTGYMVYESPNTGGKVKEHKYKVYPETLENAQEMASILWNKVRVDKGYVKVIGNWDKYSYLERVEGNLG